MALSPQELLERLIQHKPRFAPKAFIWEAKETIVPAFHTHADHQALLNDLDFFETEFLELCRTDPGVIRGNGVDASQICELIDFLDDVVNEALVRTNAFPDSSMYSHGNHPRIEKLLSFLDTAPGRFDLAGASSRSLFLITKPYLGRTARSLIEKANLCLSKSQRSATHTFPNTVLEERRRGRIPTITPHLNGDEHRQFVNLLLNSLHSEFSSCNTSGAEESGVEKDEVKKHDVMLQLPKVPTLEQRNSEVGVDALIRCPNPNSWQDIKYRLET